MTRSTLLLSLALIAPAALAQNPVAGERADGRATAAAQRFADADRNRDGRLSLAEWQDAQDRRLAERFQRMDANRDGALTQDEMRQSREARRQRRGKGGMHGRLMALDTNKDKLISRAELGDSHPRLADKFDRLDANRDGKLSREELAAMRRQRRGDAAR